MRMYTSKTIVTLVLKEAEVTLYIIGKKTHTEYWVPNGNATKVKVMPALER